MTITSKVAETCDSGGNKRPRSNGGYGLSGEIGKVPRGDGKDRARAGVASAADSVDISISC